MTIEKCNAPIERSHRLCSRGDHLESLVPERIGMTEAEVITLWQEIGVQQRHHENIEKFIQKVHKYVGIGELTPYALRELVSAI